MRPPKPPRLATWLLEELHPNRERTPIAGDLIEAYHSGHSRSWYWREVLVAILFGFYDEIKAHPLLTLRSVLLGWAILLLFYYSMAPRFFLFLARFIRPSGYPFGSSMLIWSAITLSVHVASGWTVARLHRPLHFAGLLLFACSVSGLQLPWIWFEVANAVTNARFLPYLLYAFAVTFLWPTAVLFGGLVIGRSSNLHRSRKGSPSR